MSHKPGVHNKKGIIYTASVCVIVLMQWMFLQRPDIFHVAYIVCLGVLLPQR